jgi:hypothetical protein
MNALQLDSLLVPDQSSLHLLSLECAESTRSN